MTSNPAQVLGIAFETGCDPPAPPLQCLSQCNRTRCTQQGASTSYRWTQSPGRSPSEKQAHGALLAPVLLDPFFTIRFRYQKTGYSRLTKEHPIMAPGPGPVTILLSKSPRWKPKMSRFFTWISMSVSLPRYNSKSVVTTTVGLLFCPGAVANL